MGQKLSLSLLVQALRDLCSRGQQVEQVLSRVGRVFQDVGCPAQAARPEGVLQGGLCATSAFLGDFDDPLKGSPFRCRAYHVVIRQHSRWSNGRRIQVDLFAL